MEPPSSRTSKLSLPRCPVPSGWGSIPLGAISDEDIASDFKRRGTPIGRSSITRARHVLGIPTFVPPKTPKPAPSTRIDWNAQPLGIISDKPLARYLGLTHPAVLHQRRIRNIPPARRSAANKLLTLVQLHPGLSTLEYAALLNSPLQRPLSFLLKLGLVTRSQTSLNPVLQTRTPRKTQRPKPPNPGPEPQTPSSGTSYSTFDIVAGVG
jgi:hypothetical protein